MDWPAPRPVDFYSHGSLSVAGEKIGAWNGATSATAWPLANLALYMPLLLAVPVTVTKIAVGAGPTAGGNFDVGVMDASGHKIVSTGATAKGADTEQVIDITDTSIGPGVYYFAMSCDGTGSFMAYAVGAATRYRILGMMQQASAYPLPSTATFAQMAQIYLPAIALYLKGY